MSIATIVTLHPSQLLQGLVSTMAVANVLLLILLGTGLIADLALIFRLCLIVLAGVVAISSLRYMLAYRHQRVQFFISATGQIRGSFLSPSEGGAEVQLLPQSTLWSHFLLLRLQTEAGRIIALPVFSDSTTTEGFRALSVACRWIATRPSQTV